MTSRLRTIVQRLIESRRPTDLKEARSDLLHYEVRRKDLPDLYWALQQHFPDDRAPGSSARSVLLIMLSSVHDAGTATFLQRIFSELPTNPSIYEVALGTLAKINTPKSLRTLCDILIKHEPALRSEDNGIFAAIIDEPRHACVMFPELTKLLANKLYRRGIYDLAAAMLNARTVSPEALRPACGRLMEDFRAVERLFLRTRRDSIEHQGRMRYVRSILTVIAAFPDDADLRAKVQRCASHKDTQIAFAAYQVCRRNSWEVPEDASERFAAEPATRLGFFEFVREVRSESEFPSEWRTQEAFAEGDMVRWLMYEDMLRTPPLRIKLFERRVVTLRGQKGRVYIYKFKTPTSDREWEIGLSGPQPLDLADMVVRGVGTFSARCSLRDQTIDEHLVMMEDEIARKKKDRAKNSKRVTSIEPGHSDPDVDSIPISKMTSSQLHSYANGYNWDGGVSPMHRIIRRPECDLGTALLIFWRTDPRYYYESHAKGGSVGVGTAEWALLQYIVRKVERGIFQTAEFPFDPRSDAGHDWTAGKPSASAIGIPDFMCAPVRAGQTDWRTISPINRRLQENS